MISNDCLIAKGFLRIFSNNCLIVARATKSVEYLRIIPAHCWIFARFVLVYRRGSVGAGIGRG